MRLFIGIELPDVLRNSVAAVASRVREEITRGAPDAQVRWVPPANLHITVWFLGEVREPRVEPLVASLTPPLDARSFTLRDRRRWRLSTDRCATSDLAGASEWPRRADRRARAAARPTGAAWLRTRGAAVFPAPDHRAGQRCSSARRTSDARPSRRSGGRCRPV